MILMQLWFIGHFYNSIFIYKLWVDFVCHMHSIIINWFYILILSLVHKHFVPCKKWFLSPNVYLMMANVRSNWSHFINLLLLKLWTRLYMQNIIWNMLLSHAFNINQFVNGWWYLKLFSNLEHNYYQIFFLCKILANWHI